MGDDRSLGAVEKELTHALGLFARTARARPLYSANNQVLVKMMAELARAFARLFLEIEAVTLSVRPDAFIFDETAVLEEKSEPSVPFLFFRDGVRRIELLAGLTEAEIEVLLEATAHGLGRRGLDDDVVSILWRHQLEHVRYVTVDTTIVDAGAEDPGGPTIDIDAQINALIQSIYGAAVEEDGVKSIHIDSSDLSAKGIADALGSVDEMAPGFFPPKSFIVAPVYGDRLVAEVARETDASVLELAATAAAEALARTRDPIDAAPLGAALLAIFDAALLEERLVLLKRVIEWIHALGDDHPQAKELKDAALSEARVRQLATIGQNDPTREAEVMKFLSSCGRAVVPALVALLPSLTEPRQRRAYSDLALAMGTQDVEPILQLLASEQGFVAAEALHMLAEMGKIDRQAARVAMHHSRPQVRLAALQVVDRVEAIIGEEIVLELLDDREPRVRMEALKLLSRFESARAKGTIEATVAREDFEEASQPVKEAFLKAYVHLAGRHAFERLDEMIRATDRRLARRQVEEVGVAAVIAIASLPTPRSIEILKKACLSRNKKVREHARTALKRMRKDFE